MAGQYSALNEGIASGLAGLGQGLVGGFNAMRQNERAAVEDAFRARGEKRSDEYLNMQRDYYARNQAERDRALKEKKDAQYAGYLAEGADPKEAHIAVYGEEGSPDRQNAIVATNAKRLARRTALREKAYGDINQIVRQSEQHMASFLAKAAQEPGMTQQKMDALRAGLEVELNGVRNQVQRLAAQYKATTGEDVVYSLPGAPQIDVTKDRELGIKKQLANAATTSANARMKAANASGAGAGKLPLTVQQAKAASQFHQSEAANLRQQATALRNKASSDTLAEGQREGLLDQANAALAKAAEHEDALKRLLPVIEEGTQPAVNVSVQPRDRTNATEAQDDLDPVQYPMRQLADTLSLQGVTREQAAQLMAEEGYDENEIAGVLSYFQE